MSNGHVLPFASFVVGIMLCASAPEVACGQGSEAGEGRSVRASLAEEENAPAATAEAASRFRIGLQAKVSFRNSRAEEFPLEFPFPPDFIPPGETQVYMRTPDAGRSLEVSSVALSADADFTPSLAARLAILGLDLYNRNPTSMQDRLFLREAWIRLGRADEPLRPLPGSTFFVQIGKASRFSRQANRQLESYGLWGTAIGRFEQTQIQAGGSLGSHVYFRLHVANGNPLLMRDPNALAGDNGTPERVPGNVHPIYQSGFPILYDTHESDVNFDDRFEVGGGLGARFAAAGSGHGVDILGWYFERQLEDAAPIRGSFYQGDLELLRGAGIPLATSGRDKIEYGLNAMARLGSFRLFAQGVRQEIAGLPRAGFEAELSAHFALPGLLASGDQPLLTWVRPVVRYSQIDNDFSAPPKFVAPSFAWDWKKLDVGLRVGIIREVDVTVEYTLHDVTTERGKLHPDELLVTLRCGI
ncbi:MAG: hypothetical protein HYV63_16340 [Candidatus Schekmanbacteria bacterium]|nr:hypothetical protein [Candidatus Schekmanbacteria bacterium]